MAGFHHTYTEITSAASSGQNCLPLPLAVPIKIEGKINKQRLQNEIETYQTINSSSLNNTNKVTIEDKVLNFDIGIDEVGRGPLYGSVVVAAVILPGQWSAEIEQDPLKDTPLAILTDSKKLTEVKRERLYDPIMQHCISYILVETPAAVIDEINILQATMLSMRLAAENLMIQIKQTVESYTKDIAIPQVRFNLLVDGNKLPELDWRGLQANGIGNYEDSQYRLYAEAWVKGDARHTAIAAASVLAKVNRDRQVTADAAAYPGYGLEDHKGYPTKAHIEAIKRFGVLPGHRRSFKPIQQALAQTNIKTDA